MTRVLRAARRFQDAENAMAASEYALVLGLVVLLLFVLMSVFGGSVKAQWQKVSNFHSPPACDNATGSAPEMNPNCQ